jgi:hypothetical protein
MPSEKPPLGLSSMVGLCGNCQHSRVLESDKGSAFMLCQLSQTDHSFPKYPRLPVLICQGFTARIPGG